MKAKGNGKAALWAQFRKDLPLAKSLLRDTAIGMPAWDLDKWKEIVGRTDKSKAGMLATQIEWWQHSIGVTCILIDADRKAVENTTDRIEGQAPDIIELGDKKIRNCAWQYMGTQKQYLTIGQTVSRYGGAILDKVFKSIPLMVCGENGTTPQILDLHRFANNALPIKWGGWELPEGGNLSASVIRVAIIGNALAALVRLLEVCKRTHPKCAASVEELEIDIENFNGELFNGYSLALLDMREKLLADFRRARVSLADIPDAQTGADARQADGTTGALPVVRLDENSKREIAQAVADGTECHYWGLRYDVYKARKAAEANGEKIDSMASELAAWRLFVTMVLAGKMPDVEACKLSANVRRKVCETWDEYTRGEADIAETKANDRTRKRSFKECLEVWGERPIYKGQTLKQLVGDIETFRKIVHNRDEQTRQKKAKSKQ